MATEKTNPVTSFTVLDGDFEITPDKPTISHHVATLNSRGVPVTSEQVIEASCDVDPHRMKVGDPVYIPAPDGGQHTIKGGESLSVIAKKYGVSLARLKEVNPHLNRDGRNFDLIYPGEKIYLPTAEHVCGTTPLIVDATSFDEDFKRANIETRPDDTFTLQLNPYETSAVADASYAYDPGYGYTNTAVLYDSLIPLLGGSGVFQVSTDFASLGNQAVAEATVASQEKPMQHIIFPKADYVTVYGINEDLPAELREVADRLLIITSDYLDGSDPSHELKELMDEHTGVYLVFQKDYPKSEYISALQCADARLHLRAAREASNYRDRDGFFELGVSRAVTALQHVTDGTTDKDKITRRKDKILALAAEFSLAAANKLEGMDAVVGLRKFMPIPFVNKVTRARVDLPFYKVPFTSEAQLWYEVAKSCKVGEAIDDGRNEPTELTIDHWRFLYHAFDQGLSGSQRKEAMAYAQTQIDILTNLPFDEVPSDTPEVYVSTEPAF